MVRLAFAVMVEADADIMLIDEVLAVGDAAFAAEVHRRLPREARRGQDDRARHPRHGDRRRRYCDRAMLIHDGELQLPRRPRGDGAALLPAQLRRAESTATAPRAEVSRRQRARASTRGSRTRPASGSTNARAGRADRARRRARGAPRPRGAGLRLPLRQRATATPSSASTGRCARAGARPRRRGPAACGSPGRIENPLLPGRYFVSCLIVAQPRAGRRRACRRAAARLRRLRRPQPRAGQSSSRTTPTWRRSSNERPSSSATFAGPSALGGGRQARASSSCT